MKAKLIKFGWVCVLLLAGTLSVLAADDFVVIANPSVVTDSLSTGELKDVYTAKTKYWDNGQVIVIVVLAEKTDAALQQASGMNPSQFRTFWQRLVFSGRGQEPKKVNDAASLVALVATTKGAIAIVPVDTALSGVKTIEIQ